MDRELSNSIFGNKIPDNAQKKALKAKKKFVKEFGDDTQENYPLSCEDNSIIGPVFNVKNVIISDKGQALDTKKGMIVGNIRMGFGHYRIAMAIASAVKHRGFIPYWFDLPSFKNTTCGKVIAKLNSLYSLGSRLSQQYGLFNKFYWEPLNYEGFKKLTFNAQDQKVSELFTPICKNLPKDMPFLATHVWPAQAAVHAGMSNVLNLIPDNWPMALHLAEGSVHFIQSPSSYLGYRILREMMGEGKALRPIPADQIQLCGQYVDHELVSNIESDCALRMRRVEKKEAKRILITVGGAGAQKELFVCIIRKMLPYIKDKKVVLYINVGDHKNVWDGLLKEIPELEGLTTTHFDNWQETTDFAKKAIKTTIDGIHAFYHSDIFAAVYSSNLLMRSSDLIITKPSELAYYPIPKLFIKRVGGHEKWGAIRSAELGDATYECETIEAALQVLELIVNEDDLLRIFIENILKLNKIGIYNGAYQTVDYAISKMK